MTRLAVALWLLPAAALAHPEIDPLHGAEWSSFMVGLAHPLGGLDHLLAMVAVGLWAAMLGGRALWALPAGFLAASAAGGVVGSAEIALPVVEPVILGSVIVLGAALALALRPPLELSLAAVALFGLGHGAAHGLEGPSMGLPAYGAGLMLATAGLHLVGVVLGTALARIGPVRGPRLIGGAATLAGVVLVFL